MAIPFTQYLRPDGRRVSVTVDRSPEVEAKARVVIDAGLRFECEVLSDRRTVSLTVADPVAEKDVAIEVVPNGPEVPEAVDRLVESAYRLVTMRAKAEEG